MNNMGREIMAALKRFQVGSDGDGVTVGGSLVVSGSTTVNTFNVDVISEKTSAAGVTIDGVLLKDNGVVTGAGTVSAPVYSTTGDLNTGIFFPAADTIAFAEGGAEAMRIDDSGRTLIGTTSPFASNNAKLYIAGDSNSNDGGFFIGRFQNTSGGVPAVHFIKSRGASIGTNTVLQNGDELGVINFRGADGTNYITAGSIRVEVDGTPGTNDMPGRLIFSTTADGASSVTERARIHAAGGANVGGTGTDHFFQATSGFTDRSTICAQATSGSFADYNIFSNVNRNTTNNSYYHLRCRIQGVADKLLIADSGNVTNTNNSYGQISDIKTKQDIVDAASQWDDIKNVRVRKFRFKNDPTGPLQIGVVAQELETVSAGLIEEHPDYEEIEITDEDGNVKTERNALGTTTKSVKYSVLYMKAVKALQEAMERIETLEAKNDALEARLSALEQA